MCGIFFLEFPLFNALGSPYLRRGDKCVGLHTVARAAAYPCVCKFSHSLGTEQCKKANTPSLLIAITSLSKCLSTFYPIQVVITPIGVQKFKKNAKTLLAKSLAKKTSCLGLGLIPFSVEYLAYSRSNKAVERS